MRISYVHLYIYIYIYIPRTYVSVISIPESRERESWDWYPEGVIQNAHRLVQSNSFIKCYSLEEREEGEVAVFSQLSSIISSQLATVHYIQLTTSADKLSA